MTKKTVFVVGAGASREVGLPTGNELKSKIRKLLDLRFDYSHQIAGDPDIVQALRLHLQDNFELDVRELGVRPGDINPYLNEAWHIRDALPQAISIDNFIDTQRGNKRMELCGKLAIVSAILEAERKSSLYFERKRFDSIIDFNAIENTWYNRFFNLIIQNCTKDELEDRLKGISLIVFNYDRCIEHFLFHALKNYYRIDDNEAASFVDHINIYHPYGEVGSLPWADPNRGVDFGVEALASGLLELSAKIKTFTEGTDPDSSEIRVIRESMETADQVVFLGFAFHELNMQLITPDPQQIKNSSKVKCFATVLNISASDKEVVGQQINQLFPNGVELNMVNKRCTELFTEFWRSISL